MRWDQGGIAVYCVNLGNIEGGLFSNRASGEYCCRSFTNWPPEQKNSPGAVAEAVRIFVVPVARIWVGAD
jgi:hypothetical protein